LSEDMSFYVVFGTNDEKGEDARISVVEMIEIDEGISDYGWIVRVIGVAKNENRAGVLPQTCIVKHGGLVEENGF